MNKIKPWLSAMRLRTLPLSVSGIILGSCFAYYNGHFDPIVLVLALLTTISLQVLSNLANDYGDSVNGADNDERVGPQRAVQSGEISPDEMFHAIRMNILIVIGLTLALLWVAFGTNNFTFILIYLFFPF